MKDFSKGFEDELEIFRRETQSGTQFFYSYLAINAEISDNKKALDAVNETPLFWGTISSSRLWLKCPKIAM